MSTNIYVTKRSGKTDILDIEKIHNVLQWSVEGVEGVSVSEIEIKAKLQFYNKIKTEDIHKILIKTTADLTSLKHPNYQIVASRLLLFDLRKKVWGGIEPPTLKDFIINMINADLYDREIIEKYSDEDLEILNSYIDHSKDYNFVHSGLQQLIDKYLISDRVNNALYETPQFLYMLVAMTGFINEDPDVRLGYVKQFYTYSSDFKINLPTPILASLRTYDKQYASCVLMAVDDNLESISSTGTAIMKYASLKSGIGLHPNIRAIGSSVRKGAVVHTGTIPFYRFFESALKSTSQGGLRGASATVYFPWWHYEVLDLLMLKDNAGTEDNRVRKLDYGICLDDVFYEALEKGQDVYLFDSAKLDIYDHFGTEGFRDYYESLINNPKVRKTKVPAVEIFEKLLIQRLQTGRIYILNMDEVNRHSSFKDLIKGSNLCIEVTQPTSPFKSLNDPDGEISLCTLLAYNVGLIKEKEYNSISYIATRFLDNLLSYQEYPFSISRDPALKRRNIGIGITNLAYYLAKNKLSYRSDESLSKIHELAETIQYSILKASNDLAKERGTCEWFNRTKYSDGILPIDTYNRNVDSLGKFEYKKDWNELRDSILEYGTRFSTHTAFMPCESSSIVTNSTNGVEPIRDFLINKKSKSGILKVIVPEFSKLSQYYDLVWEGKWDNIQYLKIISIFQKFIDQSISANMYYSNGDYETKKVPLSLLAKEIIFAKNHGVKAFYYANINDGSDGNVDKEESCESGSCAI